MLFEVILVTSLICLLHQSEISRTQLMNSRQLLGHINAALTLYIRRMHLSYLIAAGVAEDNVPLIHSYETRANKEVAAIEKYVGTMDSDRLKWQKLYIIVKDSHEEAMLGSRYFGHGDKLSAAKTLAKAHGHFNEMFEMAEEMVRAENTNEERLQNELTRTTEIMYVVLVASALVSVFLACALAYLFRKNTTRRLSIIMENTRRIAAGQAPNQTVDGGDELAQIDSLYHDLYRDLEHARHQERVAFEKAAEAMFSLDTNFRISDANQAAGELFRCESDDLISCRLVEFIHDDSKPAFRELLKKTAAGQRAAKLEVLLADYSASADTPARNALVTASLIDETEGTISCIIQDISERKEIETLKQDFVSMISHDLRSPLTSIQMTLDWIGAEIEENSNCPPALMQSLRRSQSASEQMLMLVDSLLDVEKFESGAMPIERDDVHLRDVIVSSLDCLEGMARKGQVRLRAYGRDDVKAFVDGYRIQQVVTNLVGNALKFSPIGSEISVHLSCDKTHFQIRVSDQGAGISAEELPFVFDKYRQMANQQYITGGRKKGSGLGLAICKTIVEAHGGTIEVQSKQGSGCVFSFRIPKNNQYDTYERLQSEKIAAPGHAAMTYPAIYV